MQLLLRTCFIFINLYMLIVNTQEEVTQIAVGLVKKVHHYDVAHESSNNLQFCPPKGAQPASKGRPDTLCQDISANFGYNLNYKSRQGKKVENKDRNLPRSVFLAFNIEINKSDGKLILQEKTK